MAEHFDDVCRYCGHAVERYESDLNMWRHVDRLAASLRQCPHAGSHLIADVDPAESDVLMLPPGSLALLNKQPSAREPDTVSRIRRVVIAPIRVVVLALRVCKGEADAAAWLVEHGYQRSSDTEADPRT